MSPTCQGVADRRCDVDAGEKRYNVLRREVDTKEWEYTGAATCRGADEPEEAQEAEEVPEAEIILTPAEFRQLEIPASKIVFERDHEGYGLVLTGEHMNIYAESSVQTLTTSIRGETVEVRATPVEYEWTYGDGQYRTTAQPGERRPEGADPREYKTHTSIVYEDTGNFDVTLETVYTGQFRVGDAQWRPVQGLATVPSESRVSSIWTVDTRNVAEDSLENPDGWACETPYLTTPPWEKD